MNSKIKKSSEKDNYSKLTGQKNKLQELAKKKKVIKNATKL